MWLGGLAVVTRPTPLSSQVEELRSELLRNAQDRLLNIARLQAALAHNGIEVLGYDGSARYELSNVVQCGLCGSYKTLKYAGLNVDNLSEMQFRVTDHIANLRKQMVGQSYNERPIYRPQLIAR